MSQALTAALRHRQHHIAGTLRSRPASGYMRTTCGTAAAAGYAFKRGCVEFL